MTISNFTTAALALAVLGAQPAAAWTLQGDGSAISYVTTKNAEVLEPNVLTGLSGKVSDDGKAQIDIALSSVETYIDIRNERMRNFLFKVADHPVASLTAELDMSAYEGMAVGAVTESEFEVSIAANGMETSYDAIAIITHMGDGRVSVTSKQPIIVYADDLGYTDGIAKLQELAGLDSITPIVPVSFTLQFQR